MFPLLFINFRTTVTVYHSSVNCILICKYYKMVSKIFIFTLKNYLTINKRYELFVIQNEPKYDHYYILILS